MDPNLCDLGEHLGTSHFPNWLIAFKHRGGDNSSFNESLHQHFQVTEKCKWKSCCPHLSSVFRAAESPGAGAEWHWESAHGGDSSGSAIPHNHFASIPQFHIQHGTLGEPEREHTTQLLAMQVMKTFLRMEIQLVRTVKEDPSEKERTNLTSHLKPENISRLIFRKCGTEGENGFAIMAF